MSRYLVAEREHTLSVSDEWLTPPWMIASLGPFDLDPCAAEHQPWQVAPLSYTVEDGGLTKKWKGRVWVNPPLGPSLVKWMRKLSAHGNGMALLPLRSTDAGWFHDYIWNSAHAVLFLRGRMRMYSMAGQEAGSCPHASLLVAYGTENALKLASSTELHRPIIAQGRFLWL